MQEKKMEEKKTILCVIAQKFYVLLETGSTLAFLQNPQFLRSTQKYLMSFLFLPSIIYLSYNFFIFLSSQPGGNNHVSWF